jgi:hypothetical protein
MTDPNSEDSYASEVSRRKFFRTGSTTLAITALLGVKANASDKKVIKNGDRRTFAPSVSPKLDSYGVLTIDGLNIAYREAGQPGNPKLVLLHGFPSSSHQYRNLIPALADHFHVISPDYPGFGNSDVPDPEKLAKVYFLVVRQERQ